MIESFDHDDDGTITTSGIDMFVCSLATAVVIPARAFRPCVTVGSEPRTHRYILPLLLPQPLQAKKLGTIITAATKCYG